MSHTSGTATDYLDLLDQFDAFLTDTGHAWAKSFTGTGNGDIVSYIGTADSVAETFTITATSATNFDVVGSTSGTLADATVGTPYTSAVIDFTIQAGGTAFVAGDVFTLTTSPAWTRERAEGCADQSKRSTNMVNVENLFDDNINTQAFRNAATTGYVEFEMHLATEVREFVLVAYEGSNAPRDFRLQWKDNVGDAWTTAQSWSAVTWSNNQARVYTLTSAPGAHNFWRFDATASNGVNINFASLDMRTKQSDAYGIAEHAEYVWKAPGLDGTKSIYVGMQTYGSANSDTWNLGFSGFRSFNQALGIAGQPNGSGVRWLSLINSPISYWFVVNGQRAVMVVKFGSSYEIAYLGFGLPYEPPSVHEFPHIIAAAHNTRTLRYDSQSGNMRYPLDPGEIGMSAFYPDAQWRNHVNRYASNSDPEGSPATQYGGKVWPACLVASGDQTPFQFRENLDGSRALLPAVLYHYTTPQHTWGELDGLYWTSGFGTVSESTIRESLFDHLVVNNVFRTGTQHYAAVRLD